MKKVPFWIPTALFVSILAITLNVRINSDDRPRQEIRVSVAPPTGYEPAVPATLTTEVENIRKVDDSEWIDVARAHMTAVVAGDVPGFMNTLADPFLIKLAIQDDRMAVREKLGNDFIAYGWLDGKSLDYENIEVAGDGIRKVEVSLYGRSIAGVVLTREIGEWKVVDMAMETWTRETVPAPSVAVAAVRVELNADQQECFERLVRLSGAPSTAADRMEIDFIGETLTGTFKFYYDDARSFLEGKMDVVAGNFHGLSEQYFRNGSVRSTGSYTRGIEDGEFTGFHESGNLKYEHRFDMGRLIGDARLFAADGALIRQRTARGESGYLEREFSTDGQLVRMSLQTDGEPLVTVLDREAGIDRRAELGISMQ